MLQKTILMRCLTLGISNTVFFSFLQCKGTVDYFVQGTYVYVNNTDSLVEVKRGPYNFTIKPSELHTIEQAGEGSDNISELNYVAPFQGGQIIRFGNTQCDTLIIAKEGITGIGNYTSEKVGKRHYKFTYVLTSLDYNKARPCK